MGTFWTMDNSHGDEDGRPAADGFMGVMPYRYYYDTEGRSADAGADPQDAARVPGDRLHAGLPGRDAADRGGAPRTLEAGKELNGRNMKTALSSIRDFDTGGIIGVPLSIKGNSIPIGRVYRADFKQQKMVPASDWIDLSR